MPFLLAHDLLHLYTGAAASSYQRMHSAASAIFSSGPAAVRDTRPAGQRRPRARTYGPPEIPTVSKGFLKAGHLPTLFAAFLYFDLSSMVWVLLGPLGVAVAKELQLDPAHKGHDGGNAGR